MKDNTVKKQNCENISKSVRSMDVQRHETEWKHVKREREKEKKTLQKPSPL